MAASKSAYALERIFDLLESDDDRVVLAAAQCVLAHAFGTPGKQREEDRDERSSVTVNVLRLTETGEHNASQTGAQAVSTRVISPT